MSDLGHLEVLSLVRGYHAYMNIWIPTIGETLDLWYEPNNSVDEKAVAVVMKQRVNLL